MTRVEPGGLGEALGLEPGDVIRSIAGRPVRDLIDVMFLAAGEHVRVQVQKRDSRLVEREAQRDYGRGLGVQFREPVFDGVRRCENRCVFCFVDRLPPGLRPSLYVKDDDYRLSFLQGSFITLTNLRGADLRRIVRLRLSPLRVSVHSTDPALRSKLMGNPRAGPVLERMSWLAARGIRFHCQVVLCPGLNDGEALERTVKELGSLGEAVESVALVPVGLARPRGPEPLRAYTPAEAARLLDDLDGLRRLLGGDGRRLQAADELYLLAGRGFPPASRYLGFPQLENGVGLVREFLDEWRLAGRRLPAAVAAARRVVIATGVAAAPLLQRVARRLSRVERLEVRVRAVENRLFGPGVTVAGLLGAGDLLEGLRDVEAGWEVLVPAVALRGGDGRFLDDVTVGELSERLGLSVRAVPPSAGGLVAAATGLGEGGNPP